MADSDSLTEGEQLVLRLHAHGKTLVRPALVLVLILAVASVAIIVLPASVAGLLALRAVIGGISLLAALAWFGVPFLRWKTTTYEVTTRRLRLREGIVSRTGRDFPLNRISDVSFSQGLLDRMLGCGRLIVESPGEHGELVLSEIPDVQRVQGILFQLVNDEAVRSAHPNQLDS